MKTRRTISVCKAYILGSVIGATGLVISMASQAAPDKLADPNPGPVKSLDYTCISCDIDAFTAFCDKNDGGLSKNPDGTITCSIQPTSKSPAGSVDAFSAAPGKNKKSKKMSSGGGNGESKSIIYKCEGDTEYCSTTFANACRDSGGGASTDPDGGIVCTID